MHICMCVESASYKSTCNFMFEQTLVEVDNTRKSMYVCMYVHVEDDEPQLTKSFESRVKRVELKIVRPVVVGFNS